jgi:putative phosphoribosyl transferase
MFKDRTEAGKLLAAQLQKYRNQPGVILAVPRGGVPVAYEVAIVLQMPLELVLIKKLGHPMNREYAIGAVGLTDRIVVPHEEVPEAYIEKETQRVRLRLQEMQEKFMEGHEPGDISGKTVIVIDDGIATGNTLLATVQILRKSHPARIVVAVPVASAQAVKTVAAEVDEMIVVHIPERFQGVGAFYDNFTQVTDEEVLFYLNKLHYELKKAG